MNDEPNAYGKALPEDAVGLVLQPQFVILMV